MINLLILYWIVTFFCVVANTTVCNYQTGLTQSDFRPASGKSSVAILVWICDSLIFTVLFWCKMGTIYMRLIHTLYQSQLNSARMHLGGWNKYLLRSPNNTRMTKGENRANETCKLQYYRHNAFLSPHLEFQMIELVDTKVHFSSFLGHCKISGSNSIYRTAGIPEISNVTFLLLICYSFYWSYITL